MKERKCSMCLYAVKGSDVWWCAHPEREDVRLVKGNPYGTSMATGVCDGFTAKHPVRRKARDVWLLPSAEPEVFD